MFEAEDDITATAAELASSMVNLSFEEFMNAIIAVAMYHEPNPFIPMDVRISNFLKLKFFIASGKK